MPLGVTQRAVLSSGVAIPDSLIDNFEDTNADTPGVYESGEALSDYYSGSTDSYNRTTANVEEGQNAAERTAEEPTAVWSTPGDGLNRYVSDGDTVGFIVRDTGADPGVMLMVEEGASTPGAYGFRVFGGGILGIRKHSDLSASSIFDDSSSLTSASPSLSNDTWYWGEVELGTSDDPTHTFSLYNLDSNLSRGSEIDSINASDSDYLGESGIGFGGYSTSNTGTIADWIRVL